MDRKGRSPRLTVVASAIALGALLAGTAGALPGSNSIDRNDVQRNAITSKHIKNGQVKPVDLAKPERWRVVGASGQPAFSNGGEGDCVWAHGLEGVEGAAPVSFRKDALGRVQLRGLASATDGPGGDGVCDEDAPGEAEDGIVFVLPAGYRPQHLDLSLLGNAAVIVPSGGAVIGDNALPGGAVVGLISAPGPVAFLDGGSFDPARSGSAIKARTTADLGGLVPLVTHRER